MVTDLSNEEKEAAGIESVCVYCGESKEAIKRDELYCTHGRARHRYAPFSAQELSVIAQAEQAGW